MKKSILIVLYYYFPYVSGLSVYAKTLSEHLVGQGYKVTVLTTRYEKGLKKRENINGVTVLRVSVIRRIGKGVIAPSLWLKTIILACKADVVNFHLPFADAGISCLFIPKKKIYTTYHCDLNLGAGRLNSLIQKISYSLMEAVFKSSTKIIINSADYLAQSIFKKYLYKSVEIHPPVNDSNYYSVSHDALSHKLSLDTEYFKIGFAGRIVFEKGILYLLNAIPLLMKGIANFKIIIAGDFVNIAGGSVKKELDHLCRLYPDKIIFTGFLEHNELLQFYSVIDVLVLPSIDPLESFGMVQVEAMLCGTPVIASNLPGVRLVVEKTGFGALAKPRDSEDIAKKIIELAHNRPTLDPRLLDQFRLRHSIGKYDALFQSAQ